MADTEDLYRVVFAGNLTGDFPLNTTKQCIGKGFRLPLKKVERIFNGSETIRRICFRHGPRPGAIVPDRRKLASRRAVDIEALKQFGDFPGISVKKEAA